MHQNQKELPSLYCPICNRRLIDTVDITKTEMKPQKEMPIGWPADYFLKCKGCSQIIAFKKTA